jgi:hypothetical protein
MSLGIVKKLTNLAQIFLQPSGSLHRQYEALRAFFVEHFRLERSPNALAIPTAAFASFVISSVRIRGESSSRLSPKALDPYPSGIPFANASLPCASKTIPFMTFNMPCKSPDTSSVRQPFRRLSPRRDSHVCRGAPTRKPVEPRAAFLPHSLRRIVSVCAFPDSNPATEDAR